MIEEKKVIIINNKFFVRFEIRAFEVTVFSQIKQTLKPLVSGWIIKIIIIIINSLVRFKLMAFGIAIFSQNKYRHLNP